MLNTAVTGPARISDDTLAAVEREAVEHGVSRTQGPLFASRNAQLAGTRAASGPPAHFRVRVDAESSGRNPRCTYSGTSPISRPPVR